MGVAVECPVCEAVFQSPPLAEPARVQCPDCGHAFTQPGGGHAAAGRQRWRSEVTPPNASGEPPQRRRPTLPAPDPLTGLQPPPLPPTAVEVPLAGAVPAEDPETLSGIKPPGLAAIRKRRRQQQRRATWISVIAAIVFLALIVGLTTALVQKLNQPTLAGPPGAAEDPTQPVVDTVDGMGTPRASQPQAKASGLPQPPRQILLRDLPPRPTKFVTEEQLNEVWAIAQPRLIGLQVEGPLGAQSAVGLIVDSRGWVLTSLSAVAGATRIQATAAVRQIDEVGQLDPLTDEIRGVIAVDRNHDLALLSINRRFVVTLGGLEGMPLKELVTGQVLVQAAPPEAEQPYGAIETEVDQRCLLAALGTGAAREAQRRGLASADLPFFQMKGSTKVHPGTPLFDGQGRLAAIHSFVADGRPHALSVEVLTEMIDGATDDVQPLASLVSTTGEAMGRPQAVAATHPMREVSVQLNQRGTACQQFGWLPETPEQFQQLQGFADGMTQMLTYVLEHQQDAAQTEYVEQLQQQVDRWRDDLAKVMGEPTADRFQRLERLNELAIEQLQGPRSIERDRFVVFSGRVLLAGIMSPDPEAMFLAVGHDKAYLRVPFENEGQVMLPDSRWLFFIKRPQTPQRTRYETQSQPSAFTADHVQLLFAIGPLPQ